MTIVQEIAARRAADLADVHVGAEDGPPPRDLLGTLARPGLHLIGEVKRRSPSKGDLQARLDVKGHLAISLC